MVENHVGYVAVLQQGLGRVVEEHVETSERAKSDTEVGCKGHSLIRVSSSQITR
jgi:hypothetical protein